MTEAPERAVARVHLGAVEANCRRLRSLLESGTELCAVVKADGYGHGEVQCARAALAGGASWLAVATAGEAAAVRRDGISARVLVMGALTSHDARTAVAAGADVVASSGACVAEVAGFAGQGAGPVRVHVKLDTGMGRLGTKDLREARAIADAVAAHDRLELAGVMTHFATADAPGDDHFPAQLEAFVSFVRDVRQAHPSVRAHAANSAATFREPGAHFDLVRCGIAIYGLDPFEQDAAARGLVPALSLHSYVAAIKRFEPGESAGYGRTWRARQPTFVGVVPIGYGDGVRRGLSNNADVLIGGRRRPLVGTISMDNLTVDLGPDTDVEAGAPATLIGEQGSERIPCEELARRLGTISYEVTCGLTPRVRRHHLR